MPSIPVFAGLGSQTLFTAAASLSAQKPESQILLRTCWNLFSTEIREACRRGILDHDDINIEQFDSPEKLLRPSSESHQNVVIQHSTLYLFQIIRHLESNTSKPLATAGFCAGLLPAAVVATSRDVIELLNRAQDFYYVALWLGIRAESYRQRECKANSVPATLPWSLVVLRLSNDEANTIIAKQAKQDEISVTAINAPDCVTLSGRGDYLQSFAAESLTGFRTRPTNVFALYHNRTVLSSLKRQVLQDFEERSSASSASISFIASLAGGPDGAWIRMEGAQPLSSLVSTVLDHILLDPTDWVAVQAAIALLAREETEKRSLAVDIVNYGPGYGMSSSTQPLPELVTITDAQPSAEQTAANDIAIVGMAVELPDAPDTAAFWSNILQGVNSCGEIPSSRFNVDKFYRDASSAPKGGRTLKTRFGNFLKNPFLFDNRLFDISRREAKSMDPQQRVMLQVAYRALEDAGYTPDSTPSNQRATFGCWIGNATMDYTDNLRNDIDVYYSPGTLRTFQSARISYVFGWSGPSITLDTACSSSVVALHQAARAMAAGDCRSALVGAVNTITSPDMYLGLDRAHFLSPSGQCKTFDASADGYCRAEGCGAFVIKTVKDALADGDRIHAIIKAVEINQSGNAHSITHPHVPTQQTLLESLFDKAKLNPLEVTAVELHGTGTQAGDPNEMASIRRVLCQGRQPSNTVHFTSVKANIGHCEAASGMAGLAKLVLMLKYDQIPAQISLKNLNPKIQELGVDGAVISRETVPWTRRNNKPRLAILNNFGAGGSNGTVLLQEYMNTAPSARQPTVPDAHQVFGISAKSEEALMSLCHSLVSHLRSPSDEVSLRDICATMTSRRLLRDYRIAVHASTLTELIHALEVGEPRLVKSMDSRGIVFVFSGQGSQYLGMGRELMSTSQVFLDTVSKCDDWLVEHGYPGCKEVIATEDGNGAAGTDPAKMQSFQTAIFALEVALANMLSLWGLRPAAVVGHSLGEYAALVTAQVLGLFDGLALVARRAQAMNNLCEFNSTTMLAVNSGAAEVQGMIHANESLRDLEVSCSNSDTDCVVGGPSLRLKEMKEFLDAIGVKSKILDVPLAFHTKAMDPVLEELTAFARAIRTHTPTVPVVSNVYGRVILPGEKVFDAEYFARQCRNTVAFHEGTKDLFACEIGTNIAALIEIGPNPLLLPALRKKVEGSSVLLLPTIRKGVAPSETLSKLLKELYLTRSDVNWRNVFTDGGKVRMLDLPVLPFFQEEFRTLYQENFSLGEPSQTDTTISDRKLSFLRRVIKLPSDKDGSAVFETPIQDLRALIVGHLVGDYPLCPASVYHEMALSAIAELEDSSLTGSQWTLSQISYTSPLLFQEGSNRALRVHLQPFEQGYRFRLASYVPESDQSSGPVHCEGLLKRKSRLALGRKYARQATALRQRRKAALNEPSETSQIFATKAMYEKIFTRVVRYSTVYQKVVSLRIDEDTHEVSATCKAPETHVPDCELPAGNSIFMDVLLHVAGFAANLSVENDVLCICKEVRSALVFRPPSPPGERFQVICTLIELPSERLTVADAYAVDQQGEIMAHFKVSQSKTNIQRECADMKKGMAFQSVPLAKINQTFAIIAAKNTGASQLPKRPELPSKRPSLLPKKQSSHQVSGRRSSATVTITSLIAKTCGVSERSVSRESELHALGVDSLMMLELQSEIARAGMQADMAAMAGCETVGDLERVCAVDDNGRSSRSSVQSDADAYSGSDREDLGEAGTPFTPPDMSDTKSSVLLAISDVCGADADVIHPSSQLHSLGIDSLMMLELQEKLSRMANGGVYSAANLSGCETVGDIERLATGTPRTPPRFHTSASSRARYRAPRLPFPAESPAVRLSDKMARTLRLVQQPETVHPSSSGPSRAPLILMHDGSGICVQYHRLPALGRPVYAIHNSRFARPAEPWPSLESMAQEYARTISTTHEGPLILGGWSFGGVVAFQAARILMQQEMEILGVVLIDSPPPLDHQPLSDTIIEAVIGKRKASRDPQVDVVQGLVKQSFTACAQLLAAFRPSSPSAAPMPRLYLLRSTEGWRRDGTDEIEHAWLQDRSDARSAVADWERVSSSNVPWLDIPGNHFQPFEAPMIAAVSQAIGHACQELEEG